MKGIQTTYSGVRFRSRLEARWAAFFDALGIRWEYEPFDCAGWIPDFLLPGDPGLLVEVKPAQSFAEFEASDAAAKADRGARDTGLDVIGVGAVLPASSNVGTGVPAIGWFLSSDDGMAVLVSYTDSFPFEEGVVCWQSGCCPIGVASDLGSYCCRITGRYAGGTVGGVTLDEADLAWKRAGNQVQWRGPDAA